MSFSDTAKSRTRCDRMKWRYGSAAVVLVLLFVTAACAEIVADAAAAQANRISDEEIAAEIISPGNKPIIEAFLKFELGEVNQQVTELLIEQHPTLVFFIKQADRGPLDSLLFLEEQVHKLQDAQENIHHLPYSIAFSANEKKKVLGLKDVADKIVSFGIPLMKRDFYSVVVAAKSVAKTRGKDPLGLMPDPEYRDAVYRSCFSSPKGLDAEMGELSHGELICMQLGWVLEQVTVTKIWLLFNDNKLPAEGDYMAYRTKRSEYFQQRLKRIYGHTASPEPIR